MKRLNRVFDAIGFIYPDYCYPLRKQGKKRKTATSAISVVSKGKKIKVLTHRPRYIETSIVPKFGEETSSATVTEEKAGQESPDIGIAMEKEVAEEAKSPAPEALSKILTILFDMLREKDYPKKKF